MNLEKNNDEIETSKDNEEQQFFNVDKEVCELLSTTSKWMHFLYVVFILYICIIAISGIAFLVASDRIRSAPNTVNGIWYLVVDALLIIPALKMKKRINSIRDGIKGDNNALKEALKINCAIWEYWGVFTIVTIVLVLFVMIAALST